MRGRASWPTSPHARPLRPRRPGLVVSERRLRCVLCQLQLGVPRGKRTSHRPIGAEAARGGRRPTCRSAPGLTALARAESASPGSGGCSLRTRTARPPRPVAALRALSRCPGQSEPVLVTLHIPFLLQRLVLDCHRRVGGKRGRGSGASTGRATCWARGLVCTAFGSRGSAILGMRRLREQLCPTLWAHGSVLSVSVVGSAQGCPAAAPLGCPKAAPRGLLCLLYGTHVIPSQMSRLPFARTTCRLSRDSGVWHQDAASRRFSLVPGSECRELYVTRGWHSAELRPALPSVTGAQSWRLPGVPCWA